MKLFDRNSIRLEGRFVGHAETPSVTLYGSLVSYHEPQYSTQTGADGSSMQSVREPACLIATGLPQAFNRAGKGAWTHAMCPKIPDGEAELYDFQPMGRDGARFILR